MLTWEDFMDKCNQLTRVRYAAAPNSPSYVPKIQEVKQFANRNGKFGDLLTENLSEGCVSPPATHCRNGPAFKSRVGRKLSQLQNNQINFIVIRKIHKLTTNILSYITMHFPRLSYDFLAYIVKYRAII